MPIYKKVNKNFFKKWSDDMAYVLGFFAADGNMLKNKRGSCFIEFHITDKNLLYSIRSLLESNHKISERLRKDGWKLGYRLQIGSYEMFQDLLKLGFTQNKSKTLQFPNVPDKFMQPFVRGYFDGDGGVYCGMYKRKENGKLRFVFKSSFTSGSKNFLLKLHDVLKKQASIKGGFLCNKSGNYELSLSHHDSLALYQFMYNNVSTSTYLQRKKEIFEKAFKRLGYMRW